MAKEKKKTKLSDGDVATIQIKIYNVEIDVKTVAVQGRDLAEITRKSWRVERYRAWAEVSRQCAVAMNRLQRLWLVDQTGRGHDEAARRFIEERTAWAKLPTKERGKAPKLEADPWPKDFAKRLAPALREVCESVNTGVLSTLIQKRQQLMRSQKATNSTFNRWLWQLSDRGEVQQCSYQRGHAIALRPDRVQWIPPVDGEAWKVRFFCDRWMRPRTGTITSTIDVCELATKHHKAEKLRDLLNALFRDKTEGFVSSAVTLCKKRDGWYIHLTYARPKQPKPELDAGRTAFLFPGRSKPWRLRLDGRSRQHGGRGRDVAYRRRVLMIQRWSRKERDRLTMRRNVGKRGALPVQVSERLTNQMADFAKTRNQVDAKNAIGRCVHAGVGRLVLYRPVDGAGGTRFLETAGVPENAFRPGSWPWYQFVELLKRNAEKTGVVLEIRDENRGFCPKVSGASGEVPKGYVG